MCKTTFSRELRPARSLSQAGRIALVFAPLCALSCARLLAAETPVAADSFTIGQGRAEGAALKGTRTESGELVWKTAGAAVLRQDGALTTGDSHGISAWLTLPQEATQAPIRVRIDCRPPTTDWVGLALGGELGDFFKTAKIALILRPSGGYGLFAGEAPGIWTAPLRQGKSAKFDPQGWNAVELEFDPAKKTLSAAINGVDIVRNQELGAEFPSAAILNAGIHINETTGAAPPTQSGAPAVDNFALIALAEPQKQAAAPARVQLVATTEPESVVTLEPANLTQFFLRPNAPEALKFRTNQTALVCEVRDFENKLIATPRVEFANGEARVPLQLPAGFYELTLGNRKFGLVSIAPQAGPPDRFFSIDAALSWLETDSARRTDLIAILKRSGLGPARERLSWGAVNPKPDQWDWETGRQFDTLRQDYARQGVPLLELFHAAPEWSKVTASNPFPQKLAETKKSWQAIAAHWQGNWNGFEVWNEPDIDTGGDLPADQYLPLVKTVNYAFRESKTSTPVGGGVFGYFNPGYIHDCIRNGLLDQVDFVSFHTYAKAPALQQIVADYRGALTVPGHPSVPLWLTESGQPWKNGPDRPAMDEDAVTARDIAMKAVEARACGIARYFPFVFPNYHEGDRNFGLMGREVTPLRSMAGYVQAAAAFSHAAYAGDLRQLPAGVQRARVFHRGDDAIAVLYAESPGAGASVQWSGPLQSIQGMDGRKLDRLPKGAIPFSDGLIYLHTSFKALKGQIQPQTRAAELTALANKARSTRPAASPVVLQPLLPANILPGKRGYKLTDANYRFPFRIRLNNLSDTAQKVELRCSLNGRVLPETRPLSLDPNATTEAGWTVDLKPLLVDANAESVTLTASAANASPVALDLFCERDLDSYLKIYPASQRLKVDDTANWRPNISPIGHMEMAATEAKVWQLKTSFKPGDRWVYPDYELPRETDFSASDGLILRTRALAPATVRLMVKERSGATYFTPFSVVPADGGWHSVALHWADLAALPSAPPDANGQLDLDQITSISFGMNSKADENTLELSDLYLARKQPPAAKAAAK